MTDVLARNSVISVGNPVLHLVQRSCVQLHYVRNGEVVNLYRGNHPVLILNESELHIEFSCHLGKLKEDVALFIERQILLKVNSLLNTSNFQISKGDSVLGLDYNFRYVQVFQNPKIKGLYFDPNAVVDSSWFKPR